MGWKGWTLLATILAGGGATAWYFLSRTGVVTQPVTPQQPRGASDLERLRAQIRGMAWAAGANSSATLTQDAMRTLVDPSVADRFNDGQYRSFEEAIVAEQRKMGTADPRKSFSLPGSGRVVYADGAYLLEA